MCQLAPAEPAESEDDQLSVVETAMAGLELRDCLRRERIKRSLGDAGVAMSDL